MRQYRGKKPLWQSHIFWVFFCPPCKGHAQQRNASAGRLNTRRQCFPLARAASLSDSQRCVRSVNSASIFLNQQSYVVSGGPVGASLQVFSVSRLHSSRLSSSVPPTGSASEHTSNSNSSALHSGGGIQSWIWRVRSSWDISRRSTTHKSPNW